MKKVSLILFTLFAFFACNPSVEELQEQVEAKLSSASVSEGEEVYASQLHTITLSYFRKIAEVKNPCAELNGELLTGSINPENAMQVILQLPELTDNTAYTLFIKGGSIIVDYSLPTAEDLRPCAEHTIHFSTKENNQQKMGGLSNPDAIPAAVNVYNYLLEQFGQKILSSTIANVNWNFSEAELVYQATGKYPAIATMDYIHMHTLTSHSPYHGGWVVPYNNTREVEAWWQNNGLIAAGWHWNMPANEAAIDDQNGYTCTPGAGTVGGNGTTTCAKPSNIMKEGTWEKRIADEDLQKMVELLLLLQDKGIPVIWRPLHEASGNTYGQWAGGGAWFWWGIEGATAYKNLWHYMYDYFKSHGVNNLIWVWTSQNNGDIDWYPGDEYVDIVGQDIYNQGAAANAADYIRLQATYPNKIITLSECGNVGKISEQWAAGARWSYFMPWYQYNATTLDGHQHGNTQWWQDAMNCPQVVSRDQLPSLKGE